MDLKFNRGNTALSRLSNKENINILFNKSKFVYRSDFYLEFFIRESTEIYIRGSNVCNDTLSFHSPNYLDGMVEQLLEAIYRWSNGKC